MLERHGSLGIEHAKVIAAEHGFRLTVASARARAGALAGGMFSAAA